jgi:hypothetical protein
MNIAKTGERRNNIQNERFKEKERGGTKGQKETLRDRNKYRGTKRTKINKELSRHKNEEREVGRKKWRIGRAIA